MQNLFAAGSHNYPLPMRYLPAPLTPPQPATETYLLPGGKEVQIDASVARGELFVSVQLEDGRIVYAKRAPTPGSVHAFDFLAAGADAINESKVRGETAQDRLARRYAR